MPQGLRVLIVSLLLASLYASPSLAQEEAASSRAYRLQAPTGSLSAEQAARARALYVEGRGLTRDGLWADALGRFEEAYRLSGVPAALFNVAATLRSMGRHVHARDALDQLLGHEGLDSESRERATTLRAEELQRIAEVRLLGAQPDDRVHLDGLVATEAPTGGSLVLEADPGRHALSLRREGFLPFRRVLTLSDGQRLELPLAALLRAAPPSTTSGEIDLSLVLPRGQDLDPLAQTATTGERQPESYPIWASPLFWLITGTIVLGGTGLTAWILQEQAQLQPREDTWVVRL